MVQVLKRLLIIVCLAFSQILFGQGVSDSILKSLNKSLPVDQKIKLYQSLITSLWLNHPDSAMYFVRRAIQFTKESGDLKSQSVAIRLLGGVHVYKGNYDSALICSLLAYDLSVQTKDSTLISSAFNNIGFTQYHFGSYAPALENLLKSLKMKLKIHNNYGLAQTMNNIGLVYTKLKDFTKARKYFADAYIISDSLKDNNQRLYSSNNLGFTYLLELDYSNAEKYFIQSLNIARTVINNNWTATTYSGLGQVMMKKGNREDALAMFNSSLKLREEISDKNGISEVYYLLSQLNAANELYDSAFYKIRLSQSIAQKINSKNRQIENFDWLKNLFVRTKRYDSALYYQNRYMQLKDSLFNENMARELASIQVNILKEENATLLRARDAQLQRRSELINILIIVALFSIIIGFVSYQNYRRKKKLSQTLLLKNVEIINQKEEIIQHQEELQLTNEQLQLANKHIDQQNELLKDLNLKLRTTVELRTKELEVANKELKFTSLELDNFVYRSAHDLRGPLVRLIGLCQVALIDCEDIKAKEYFQLMYDTAQHLNELFDRLKSVSEINNIDIQRNPVAINFEKIVHRVKGRLKKIESFQSIRFIENLDTSIEFKSDEYLMETIFYGLLENAVKFQKNSSEADKFVKITVNKKFDKINITFTDNGIGIQENHIDYLFQMFTVAAREKKNIGLGLYIVKQAVDRLHGKIGISKSKSGYTRFKVVLPMRDKIRKKNEKMLAS